MPTLLHLDSSADTTGSVSRAVTAGFADTWRRHGETHQVVRRDLHAEPVPHLPDPALHWPPRLRAADAHPPADLERLQQEIIDELLAADAVLIGAPMYNYSLPSVLKVWLDYIHVPGVTAPFDTDTQPLAGRPCVIVSSRGGVYDPGSPTADWDHTVPPLQIILSDALGMDVSVIKVSRTLSGVVPALAEEADRAREELAEGHRQATVLADRIAAASPR